MLTSLLGRRERSYVLQRQLWSWEQMFGTQCSFCSTIYGPSPHFRLALQFDWGLCFSSATQPLTGNMSRDLMLRAVQDAMAAVLLFAAATEKLQASLKASDVKSPAAARVPCPIRPSLKV